MDITNDSDFITGSIDVEPKRDYFIVTKGTEKRNYTFDQYYDLCLRNWETTIDAAPTKQDKLQALRNAKLYFDKELVSEIHPLIELVIKKK